MSKPLVVWTNCPDAAVAHAIAAALVERRLAACVNCLAPVESIYRWGGKVEHATEFPLMIKTTVARYPDLEAAIRQLHPYDVPEIIALPIELGDAAYLRWVGAETDSGAQA